MKGELPEVIPLRDARPSRPENAVGIGEFWYEPEIWSLSLSPAARLLYTTLCSCLRRGEINHHDLRDALKGSSDAEIAEALGNLVHHNLLSPTPRGYAVNPVKQFESYRPRQ